MTGKRRAGREPAKVDIPHTLLSPTSPEVVIAPVSTRREERRQRQRRQRRKLGMVGGLVAGGIGIAAAVTFAVGVQHVVAHQGGNKRTQVTVLLQLQGSTGDAVGSVLLAADPSTREGLEVLVPSKLISDVCGYGSESFGSVLALPNGAAASRSALSSVLDGVTIDGSWILTADQLSRLVDEVGGINVDVDTDVVRRTPGGGGQIVVGQGNQHLSGAQAVEYATYQPGSEGDVAELARLQGVVDATVQALPRTLVGVEALLRQLGPGAQSTLGVSRLAQMLVELAAYDQTQAGVFPTDLPVVAIDAGGPTPSYRPDDSATGVPLLVHSRLAGSLPKNANTQHATVLVLNGLGRPGLVASACPRLLAAGFTFVGEGNTPSFTNGRSEVDVFSDNDVEQGEALARALGLPVSDLRRSVFNQDVAKFVVILGSDYKP
jgi:hypothetical protein